MKANKIWHSILILLLIIGFTSCGIRNKTTSSEQHDSKTKTAENLIDTTKTKKAVKADENIKKTVDTKETEHSVTKITTVEPVDNSKPASVTDETGKKTDLNNAKQTTTETTLKTEKESTDVTDSHKTENTTQSEDKGVTQAKASEAETHDEAEATDLHREAFNIWSLWWVALIIAFCIWYYRKYGFRLPIFKK